MDGGDHRGDRRGACLSVDSWKHSHALDFQFVPSSLAVLVNLYTFIIQSALIVADPFISSATMDP